MVKTIQTNDYFTNIPQDITVQLPETYQELETHRHVQDTLAYSEAELGGYFHKYFPRSYVETFTVFDEMISCSAEYGKILSGKGSLTLLDIGAGIGGNMIGMLKYISAVFPGVQSVVIDSVDGNPRALDYQARIISNLELNFNVRFNPVHHVFCSETLIYDLGCLVGEKAGYDIVMASKFLNEFYRKDNCLTGLYSSFIAFGSAVLNPDGILMITELTDGLAGHGYLNMAFNRETLSYYRQCANPLKQVFPIQCHLWRDCCEDANRCFVQQRYLNDRAKAFTQVFCRQSLGNEFYEQAYLNQQKRAPIRIKYTGWNGGHFCYHGKLRDTAQLS